MTLPTAPASTSASASANRRSRGCFASRYTIHAEAASAMAMKKPALPAGLVARKLNAAPGLCTSTRLKNGVSGDALAEREAAGHQRTS